MLTEVEKPLRELARKHVLFHCDKPQAAAFQKLKHMHCEAPTIAYYDLRKDLTIQFDTSKSAVGAVHPGAVLMQVGRLIAYASCECRVSELKWAAIEKEMLAIVFSAQKFRK